MKILALILARGGSKRLPGKNIRLLGGKPLIVWSIDVANDTSEICDILVSTDDIEIAAISKEAGAMVPWLRPDELATDNASSVDAALHALNWYETENGAVDGLLLLQPTSPFRTKETVKKGISLFINNNYETVLGVSTTHVHPMWTFKKDGDYLVPFMEEHGFNMQFQDLPNAYAINGCFYLLTPDTLRDKKSFIGGNVIPLLVESSQEALDIDNDWDFQFAENVVLRQMCDDV